MSLSSYSVDDVDAGILRDMASTVELSHAMKSRQYQYALAHKQALNSCNLCHDRREVWKPSIFRCQTKSSGPHVTQPYSC